MRLYRRRPVLEPRQRFVPYAYQFGLWLRFVMHHGPRYIHKRRIPLIAGRVISMPSTGGDFSPSTKSESR